jgi:hypothetical protein
MPRWKNPAALRENQTQLDLIDRHYHRSSLTRSALFPTIAPRRTLLTL